MGKRMKKWGKRLFKFLIYFTIFLVLFVIFLEWWLRIDPPEVADKSPIELKREEISPTFYKIGKNWIRKNELGLYEGYIEGAPFERGAVWGNLIQELLASQEEYFVAQIDEMIPSRTYLYLLRYLIGFFNRNIDEYVPLEYQLEIYGESHFAPEGYDAIGDAFERMLNYHGAHDIGHALQDYALVGCTSFSGWDEKSKDSSLIIGRNFDFYVGDDFAKDKIILFINPDEGHKFAMVTWAGMIGVTSGMNEKGLTVTLNAARSEMPTSAKTPIAIVARQILQYAENIEEAYAIAKEMETFVSETIMIGSAQDGKTALIEKSISTTSLLMPDSNSIICSNHYQSDSFTNDPSNLQNIEESASFYRQQRTNELLNRYDTLDYKNVAAILRDRGGLHDEDIGMGNEKALNQLIAHHGVVFMPEKRLMWLSTNPYQLGAFAAYDLNEVFSKYPDLKEDKEIKVDSLTIEADPFLASEEYKKYLRFRELKKHLQKISQESKEFDKLEHEQAVEIQEINPNYYHAHELAGNLYKAREQWDLAITAYQKALSLEIATLKERKNIEMALSECLEMTRKQEN